MRFLPLLGWLLLALGLVLLVSAIRPFTTWLGGTLLLVGVLLVLLTRARPRA
jgi:hypothetical protein